MMMSPLLYVSNNSAIDKLSAKFVSFSQRLALDYD